MLKLNELFENPPRVHRGETESPGVPTAESSVLDEDAIERLRDPEPRCYGISPELGDFLLQTTREGEHTLETGCGISTLIFAMAGAWHVCITPHESEIDALRDYAGDHDLSLDRVEFVLGDSADVLPGSGNDPVELALVDGKHAFPWPIIDWFYSARRVRRGGLIVLDDREIPAVAVVERFLASDERWIRTDSPDPEAAIFRKATGTIGETPWHAQRGFLEPQTVTERLRSFLRRIRDELPG